MKSIQRRLDFAISNLNAMYELVSNWVLQQLRKENVTVQELGENVRNNWNNERIKNFVYRCICCILMMIELCMIVWIWMRRIIISVIQSKYNLLDCVYLL
jgi:hypothetical protein